MSSAITVGVGSLALGAYSASKAGKGGSSSTTQEIDPRLAKYLYGEDDKGGLLGDVDLWYQANKSGLNDQMAQGLNTQWNVYNDPKTLGGYQQMSNLGSGLMSTPIVGNPFGDGRLSLGGGGNLGMGSQQPQAQQQAPQSYGMPASAQQSMPAAPGPFSSAQPAYQTAAPAPAPAQSSGWEDLFDPNKTPMLSSDKNKDWRQGSTNWQWNGSMWQPARYETGGA